MLKESHEKAINEIVVDIRDIIGLFEDATKMELSEAEREIDKVRKKLECFFLTIMLMK